jgi:acyl-CoA thioesterase YciA
VKYIASTIVRASDIGLNNNLFGGTLLRWLDEYGALFTYKYLNHRFVTYKMEKTYFLKSAKQGDCIDFYVTNLKFDKISVNFDLVAKINSFTNLQKKLLIRI